MVHADGLSCIDDALKHAHGVCVRAGPKVMPPVSLCRAMIPEVEIGGVAVENEHSQ